MRKLIAPALLLLLAACGGPRAVQHGNAALANVEDETRRRALMTLKQMNSDEKDVVKYDAPSTRAQKLQNGDRPLCGRCLPARRRKI